MAKSTQLVTLIIYIYTLYGLRRFLLGVTNFVAKLIYPVQGIMNRKRRRIVGIGNIALVPIGSFTILMTIDDIELKITFHVAMCVI